MPLTRKSDPEDVLDAHCAEVAKAMLGTIARAPMEKMVVRLRKGAQVLEEMAQDIEAALNATATPGQQAKQFLDHFCAAWSAKYRSKYSVNGAKDMAQIKRVLKTVAFDDLKARSTQFLASTDRFYSEAHHPLPMFLAAVNKFTAQVPDEQFLQSAPIGCKHDPPCRNDADHTRRRLQESRQMASA